MGPVVTRVVTQGLGLGVYCAGIANYTTNICPKAAFTFTFSAVVLSEVAVNLGAELFAQTTIGKFANTIFLFVIPIAGGIYVTKQLGYKIKNDDVSTLAVSAIVTPIAIGTFTIVASLFVAKVAELVLKV
jgi:predicted transporter